MNARIKARTRSAFFYFWTGGHEVFHLILGGLFYFFVVRFYFPQNTSWNLLALSLFGSVLPDIDHFFYLFVYGRKKEYTQLLKNIFHENGFRELTRFVKKNHKIQTGLVSHNLLTVITLGIVTYFSLTDGRVRTFALLGAMMTHFLMDIFDDLIYLGGLNPNWYLKFGREAKPRKNRKQVIINKVKRAI